MVPLSTPVQTAKGTFVDRLHIARGEIITIPTGFINRHEALWGPDGAEFKPERWLEEGGVPKLAQEIKGYRHLLTFWDGPRMCLGRGFALTEFKVRLRWVDRCCGSRDTALMRRICGAGGPLCARSQLYVRTARRSGDEVCHDTGSESAPDGGGTRRWFGPSARAPCGVRICASEQVSDRAARADLTLCLLYVSWIR